MREIKKVDYEYCKKHLGKMPNTVLGGSKYEYFVLIDNGVCVSMVGLDREKKRTHSAYTPVQYRKRGYSFVLHEFLVQQGLLTNALCTKDSLNMMLKLGFVVTHRYDKVNSKGEPYSLWAIRKADMEGCNDGKTTNRD